jgi:hypothetical protein
MPVKSFVKINGKIHVVSNTSVTPLTAAEETAVKKALKDTEKFLENELKTNASTLGSMVNVPLVEIFPTE